MPKTIPECPPVPELRRLTKETRDYQIQLITPLFGGGVITGEPDSQLPIRGTSIRGQLQFWWRASRGAVCTSRGDLFARHQEVWGTTDRASPVEIEMIWQGTPPTSVPCAEYTWDQRKRRGHGGWRLEWDAFLSGNALPYVLFPFQGKEPKGDQYQALPEKDPAHFIRSGQFILRVRFPEELRYDVETAVWAWVNFGGIGARTRRGCGSLYCAELAPLSVAANDLKPWFHQGAGTESQQTRDWPTLSSCVNYHSEPVSPMNAWNQVIELFRRFRQGEGLGRNPGKQNGRPGRSRWPEPESIRKVTKKRANQHQRLGHIPDDAFPRAEFGLPMVFHFQGQGEPPDTILYPATGNDGSKKERMSSPLILKPLALQNGQAIPVILQLTTQSLTALELRIQKKDIGLLPVEIAKAVQATMGPNEKEGTLPLPHPSVISGDKLQSYTNSPLERSSNGSALEAFLAYAKASGFTEVIR